MCVYLCGSLLADMGLLHERVFLGFVVLDGCEGLTHLLIPHSPHWYPDHRSRRGGLFYPKWASPDTQILCSNTQLWGKAGLTACSLSRGSSGGWLRTLAKALEALVLSRP